MFVVFFLFVGNTLQHSVWDHVRVHMFNRPIGD